MKINFRKISIKRVLLKVIYVGISCLVIGYVAIMLSVLLFSTNSQAANIASNSSERIQITISKSGINRISMFPHRIKQVTGDESKYKLKADEDGSNIYIMPIAKIGEKIELSIRSTRNLAQDLSLKIADVPASTTYLTSEVTDQKTGSRYLDEAKHMLRAMQLKGRGKYYVQTNSRVLENKLGLEIRQEESYQYDNLIGARLQVSNKSNEKIYLREQDFARLFEAVELVAIAKSDRELKAGDIVEVLVVTRQDNKA